MHALFFDLKRAHHGTLRVTRPLLATVGLTPARFDLLYALYDDRHGEATPWRVPCWQRGGRAVRQSDLVRLLGVSRAVVSRMLRALETLGLVVRSRIRPRGRRLWVELTASGFARIASVVHDILDPGAIELAVASIVEPTSWMHPWKVVATLELLESLHRRIRGGTGDCARLRYLWHPED